MAKQRSWIACPEYDYVDILSIKIYFRDLVAIERIRDGAEPFSNSVHEPFGIKGRNVGSATGTDDHGVIIDKPAHLVQVGRFLLIAGLRAGLQQGDQSSSM
jgi:hypothetical protein